MNSSELYIYERWSCTAKCVSCVTISHTGPVMISHHFICMLSHCVICQSHCGHQNVLPIALLVSGVPLI